jgi:hypothetical protein
MIICSESTATATPKQATDFVCSVRQRFKRSSSEKRHGSVKGNFEDRSEEDDSKEICGNKVSDDEKCVFYCVKYSDGQFKQLGDWIQ